MCNPFKAIENLGSGIVHTIENVLNDPLPIIETIILTEMGIPPFVASAAVSAANGGNISQIATAMATAYAGAEIGEFAGGQISELSSLQDLPASTQATIRNITTSASGAAAATALRGGNLTEILGAGFSAGVASSVRDQLIQKGGFKASDIDTKLITNATNSALNAIVNGRSVTDAIAASSAAVLIRAGMGELGSTIRNQVNDLTSKNETLQGISSEFNNLKQTAIDFYNNTFAPNYGDAQQKYATANSILTEYNSLKPGYDSALATYNEAKDIYDHYDARMAAQGYQYAGGDEYTSSGYYKQVPLSYYDYDTGQTYPSMYYDENTGQYVQAMGPDYSQPAPDRQTFATTANNAAKTLNDVVPKLETLANKQVS